MRSVSRFLGVNSPDFSQAQARRGSGRFTLLGLLVLVSALGPIVMNGVLPANTVVMRELSTSYGVVQLVLTVFLLANMIAQLLLGGLSDRIGRKPVMLLALGIFSIGSVICAVAGNIEMLLAGRFVQGFGAAACAFLPRTIIRDLYSRDEAASVIGYMTTAMMVGPLFGPALGGWVTDVSSWRYMYAGLAVVAAVLAIFCALLQRESLNRSAQAVKPEFLASCRLLLRSPEYVSLLLLTCGSVGVYYSFLGGAPFVVMELGGFSASQYGLSFTLVAIGYFGGNLLAGKFSARIGANRMIKLGTLPGAIGMLLLWLLSQWQHPFALFIPMFFIAVSNGSCLPNLTSAMMSVHPEVAGVASGLAGTLMTAGAIIFTFSLALVLQNSALPLLLIMTLSALIAGCGYWMLSRTHNHDLE